MPKEYIRRTAPTKKLVGKEAYERYLKKRRGGTPLTFKEYKMVSRSIFSEVGKAIVEEPDGVLLKGFGYFCVVKSMVKMSSRIAILPHTDNYTYMIHLQSKGVLANDSLKGWLMSRAFQYKIVKGVRARLKAGFKYKLNMVLVQGSMTLRTLGTLSNLKK